MTLLHICYVYYVFEKVYWYMEIILQIMGTVTEYIEKTRNPSVLIWFIKYQGLTKSWLRQSVHIISL